MKKKWTLILSIALALGMSIPSFAKSKFELENLNTEIWSQVSNNLEPENYGGIYVLDGELHIKPMDTNEILTLVEDILPSTKANSSIIIDDVAQYSVADLEVGTVVLEDYMDEYDIQYIAIDNMNNGLAIGLTEMSEDIENALIEISPIDNIKFELVENTLFQDSKDIAQETSDVSLLARPGLQIRNTNTNKAMQLGCCVKWESRTSGTSYGYITTGHSNNLDDDIEINTASANFWQPLGYVMDINLRTDGYGSIDAALIKADSNTISPTCITKFQGKEIRSSSMPIDNMSVLILGNVSIPSSTQIKYSSATIAWEDGHDSYKLRHMIVMNPANTQEGDSGSAIVTQQGGNYNIVGIYKGRNFENKQYNPVGSRWDYVASNFDTPTNVEVY